MKNAILITALLVFAQATNVFANDTKIGENLKKTIILINGAPFLVDINEEGRIIQNYLLVQDYFVSNESHENLVEKAEEEYEDEIAMLNNSRLIIFDETSALLNEAAIDNIRDLANLYNRGTLQNINITAGHVENEDDGITVDDRINAISQMLEDFGVKEGDISADVKIYRSELPNQFVKIDLLR